MKFLSVLVGAVLLIIEAAAHMHLNFPPTFNATNNPHRTTASDPYLTFPYDCCGQFSRWEYPCRGYHKLLNTPEGAPTATWAAGSSANWSISGLTDTSVAGGTHYGGSCQVGFSVDGGNTFRVATSYEGNCPHRTGTIDPETQTFDFKVPSDIPEGVQLFAWIWYNREHELNMNCAAVNIVPSTGSTSSPNASLAATTLATSKYPSSTSAAAKKDVSFDDRPLMFVADDKNDCLTPFKYAELKYPDPGPDTVPGDSAYPLEGPSGSCSPQQQLAKQGYNGKTGNDGHMGA